MKKNQVRYSILLFLIAFIFQACDDPIYVPKPRGYPKVIYPTKAYQPFSETYCPLSFEYPAYATIEQDTSFFGERPRHECWFDISIEALGAKVYCSYIPVSVADPFEKLRQDAFTMANEHIVKANYIDEVPIKTANDVEGMVFDLEGPVASPFMFYLSDGTQHYFRGALYFNTQSRPDSLAPVIKFVKEDIKHMINTFRWE